LNLVFGDTGGVLRSIPSKQEGIFVLQSVQAEKETHQATYEKVKGASYHVGGAKKPGCEADHYIHLTP
jgi:hypothetical protein